MISLQQNRPLLQTGYCLIADYDRDWLEQVLQEAADTAGLRLPLRREIAEAIMLYLETNCPLHSLPLEFLFGRIECMLHEIGMPLIAKNLRRQTPPVDVSLDEIAAHAPLPLFFYAELQGRLEKLRQLGLNRYHFVGAERCSLALSSRRRRCPAAKRTLHELQAFLEKTPA